MKKLVLVIIVLISLIFISCNKDSNKNGSIEGKISQFEKLLKENPQDKNNIIELGKLYQFNGFEEKAVELLKKAKKDYPNDPIIAIWFANSESLMAAKASDINDKVRWSQLAITDLDETVEKFNDNWFVHYLRGVNSINWPKMFHREEIAIKDFEFLIDYDNKNSNQISNEIMAEVYYNLSKLLLTSNKEKSAEYNDVFSKKYMNTEFAKRKNEVK